MSDLEGGTRPSSTGPQASTFQIRSLLWRVYVPTFLYAVGQGAVLPIIPLFAKDLGAGVGLASAIFALRGVGTMVLDVPAGVGVTRFGNRRVMIGGTAGVGVFALIAGLSGSVSQLAVMVLLMGGAFSLWNVSRLAYVTDLLPVANRGRAIALVGGTNRIGNFVGPALGGVLAATFGIEAAFYTQAILGFAAATMLFFVARQDGGPSTFVSELSVYRRIGGMLREHRAVFATAGAAVFILQLLRMGRQVLIPLWGDEIGLNEAEIGLTFSLASGVDMVMFYPTGVIMDRFGRKWAAVPCLLILGGAIALLPLTEAFVTLLAVGLLSGLGNGFGSGIVQTLGADLSPPEARGEFLGVWRLLADSGSAGGPFLISGIVGVAGLGVSAVATGGAGLIGAAIMAFLVRETLSGRGPPGRPD
jgi:MFS family permease